MRSDPLTGALHEMIGRVAKQNKVRLIFSDKVGHKSCPVESSRSRRHPPPGGRCIYYVSVPRPGSSVQVLGEGENIGVQLFKP